jgi:hypothetical protein
LFSGKIQLLVLTYAQGDPVSCNHVGAPTVPGAVIGMPAFEKSLTNLEKEILDKIATDNRNGQRTSQESLNRILGTERRSPDIQKRHRSDTLKSINEKFMQSLHTRELLIERTCSEEDQRLFDYYLNPNAGYPHSD